MAQSNSIEEQTEREEDQMSSEELLEKDVDSAFGEFEFIELETSWGNFKILSMNEMPVSRMIEFGKLPDGEKTEFLLDMIDICISDPEKWNEIKPEFSVNETMRLISQWMQKSSEKGIDE